MTTEDIWPIDNADESQVHAFSAICAAEGGELIQEPLGNGRFKLDCARPAAAIQPAAALTASGNTVIGSGGASAETASHVTANIQIQVGPSEFDALCRVAQSEVGHFGKHGADQLQGGIKAVVDTIINRTAHKSFPDTVIEVVDQRFQFSAINSLGTWSLLPKAKAVIQSIVQDYLEDRVSGVAGLLGGATHFLNPHLSSTNALNQWGNHVVANPVAVFGDNSKKDVHFHGFAPGTPLPDSYTIHFGSLSPVFDGRGQSVSSQSRSGIREGILDTLKAELDTFDGGKLKESDNAVFRRVGDYWASIGMPHDGKTIITMPGGKTLNPPWSAAFISWVVAQQGVGTDRFRGAQAHWKYFNDLIENNVSDPLFEVKDPATHAPQPGDLVHFGRGTAANFDLTAAKQHLLIDGFYPSHSDFVTEVDLAGGKITTVGGNVDNSVKEKRRAIDNNGILKMRSSSGSKFPWIAVLRLRDN